MTILIDLLWSTSTKFLLKTLIRFLWIENLLNKMINRLFTCFVKNMCVPPGFYKFICRKDNFMFLNGLNVTGHKRAKLFTNLQRRKILKWKSFELFWRYQLIYQRFYSLLFTKYFMPNRKGGVNIRSYFLLHVKEWLVDKEKR